MKTLKTSDLLEVAAEVGKFYAFHAHALRVVIQPKSATGMSEDVFKEELENIETKLKPVLSKNKVVQENMAEIHQRVLKIRDLSRTDQTRAEAIESAKALLPMLEERIITVSDLVAVFRSL